MANEAGPQRATPESGSTAGMETSTVLGCANTTRFRQRDKSERDSQLRRWSRVAASRRECPRAADTIAVRRTSKSEPPIFDARPHGDRIA